MASHLSRSSRRNIIARYPTPVTFSQFLQTNQKKSVFLLCPRDTFLPLPAAIGRAGPLRGIVGQVPVRVALLVVVVVVVVVARRRRARGLRRRRRRRRRRRGGGGEEVVGREAAGAGALLDDRAVRQPHPEEPHAASPAAAAAAAGGAGPGVVAVVAAVGAPPGHGDARTDPTRSSLRVRASEG